MPKTAGPILTKRGLIEELSRVLEVPRKEADVILVRIIDSIVRAIQNGDKVEIRGFGAFGTRQRRPRTARNPKTGTRVDVPAKRVAFFKPSKDLKEMIQGASSQPATPSL